MGSSMRNFVAFSIICVFLLSATGALAQSDKPSVPPRGVETMAGEDFTHTVFAEDITATWCQYCPAADRQLADIYYNDGYDRNFFWVALITDVNDKAMDRKDDYVDFVGYPTVYFDGGDEKVEGQQDDKSSYVDAIETCGDRDDTDITLEIAMEYLGGDTISVRVWATWNEDGTITNPTFNGYLRAYIVEPHSRYINHDGENYGFGFMDFAFDESVELDPHERTAFSTLWNGTDYTDANGDDFSDFQYPNLNVFAVIFNDESSQTDEFALQAVGALPPIMSLDPVDETVYGSVEVTGSAVGNRSSIAKLEYRVDDGEWSSFAVAEDFTHEWDTTKVENGEHVFQVRATDEFGTSNTHFSNVTVTNDENPPELEWIAPDSQEELSETITIEVEAKDPQGIEVIELSIDERAYKAMEFGGDDIYTFEWDTTTVANGDHTLTVRAEDGTGNEATLTQELEVLNEGEITRPSVDLLAPTAEDQPLNGIVEIVVEASDPGGTVEAVVYTLDLGHTNAALEPKSGTEDQWHGYWNTAKDPTGVVLLQVTAFNDRDYSTTENITFTIDNTPPMLEVDLPFANSGDDIWAIQTISIEAVDGQGTVTVEYQIDSEPWTTLSSLTDTYTVEWDTTSLEDGTHEVHVRVVDEAGNEALWDREFQVVNGELALFELTDSEPPAADEQAHLVITISREVDGVTLVITSPINAKIEAEEGAPGLWTASFPTFEDHEGAEVVYYVLMETDHGEVRTGSETFLVQPAARAPGSGDGSDDDDDNLPMVVGLVAVALVVIGGGAFYWHSHRETDDEWGAVAQPNVLQPPLVPPPGPPGMAPGVAPGMAPAPPVPAPVTCPHCQMQLMAPPGPRPMMIGCPNCSGQMQIN